MYFIAALAVLSALALVRAHGDHAARGAGHPPPPGGPDDETFIKQHMVNEHHIDTFDLPSFFALHDLDRNGFWSRGEIEAVYGVHHDWNPKDKDAEKIKAKADAVVDRVLKRLDRDHDGYISLAEFEAGGFAGLPDLKDLGAEGHHYDIESEFFLHHEELYHSTPDTQTDDSYSHPEDMEHFANHEHIEAEEAEREQKFHGLPPEELEATIPQDGEGETPADVPAGEAANDSQVPPAGEAPAAGEPIAHPHDDQNVFEAPSKTKPKVVRQDPPEKMNQQDRFRGDKADADKQPEWGQGYNGYARPKTPADKMRKNLPYKYKFRRNWGDF